MASVGPGGDGVDNNIDLLDLNADEDICRVCRLGGEEPLYHPCLCTGTIKFVHQKCLEQWLKYSRKEVCELCSHKFSFQPLYAENMPSSLPFKDLLKGFSNICVKAFKTLATYLLVGFCWLIFVPLVACRIHKLVFSGVLSSIYTFRILEFFSLQNIARDIVEGTVIVCIFVCAFIALVWLREQIAVGGPHGMLNIPNDDEEEAVQVEVAAPVERAFVLNEDEDEDNVNEGGAPVEGEEGAAQNENNEEDFVGRDVERMVEDMTWQRLIGLDGSFIFLENVFWAVSMNLVFNVLFLYFPAWCGRVVFFMLQLPTPLPYFDTAIAVLVGYFVIAQLIFIYHYTCKQLKLNLFYTLTGMGYLMIKVFLLVTMELCIFPIICGWWLDICSLPLTGSTLDSRIKSFQSFPYSSTVLHWLAGMLYVFYSASFILTLRGLLRPGVLWFIRNLNDPEFNPIQEMIDQPVTKHFRRLIASTSLFLLIIFLVVYTPLQLIKTILPSVIPYTFDPSETPISEFSMELMLLQVILPTVLEYAKAYNIFKAMVKWWCLNVGGLLKLDTYLLPIEEHPNYQQNNENQPEQQQPLPIQQNEQEAGEDNNADLAARHHALLMVRRQVNIQEYQRPDNFQIRLIALLWCVALTVVLIATFSFVVPVTIGRVLLKISGLGVHPIHEIYTVGCGLYACWLIGKTWLIWSDWIHKGWDYVRLATEAAVKLVFRLIVAAVPLIGLIPFLLGLYFQLVVISPLRVGMGQTPIFFPWKEWAMGVVHFKILVTSVLMGPDWWMKTSLEQLCNDGVRGLKLKPLYMDIVIPTVNMLFFLIAAPLVASKFILNFLDWDLDNQLVFIRMSYPFLLITICIGLYVRWQWKKLKALCQRIRNEKYLIGTQLVNFYRDLPANR